MIQNAGDSMQDGSVRWPRFPSTAWAKVALIKQLQLVHKTTEHIEIPLVTRRTLEAREIDALDAAFHACLGSDFVLSFYFMNEISCPSYHGGAQYPAKYDRDHR